MSQIKVEGGTTLGPEGSLLEALLQLGKQKRMPKLPQALPLKTSPTLRERSFEKAEQSLRQLRWEQDGQEWFTL